MIFQMQLTDLQVEPKATTSTAQFGVSFASSDGKDLFVARRDGLSVHRLHPYTQWAKFREEAKRLWDKYKRIAAPQAIDMLVVRNINRLELSPDEQLESFVRLYPVIPEQLPQQLSNFAMSVDLPLGDLGRLIVNEGFIPPVDPNKVGLLLDITACKQLGPTSENVDEAAMWSILDQLRDAKDRAFEACITDTVRKMIS